MSNWLGGESYLLQEVIFFSISVDSKHRRIEIVFLNVLIYI